MTDSIINSVKDNDRNLHDHVHMDKLANQTHAVNKDENLSLIRYIRNWKCLCYSLYYSFYYSLFFTASGHLLNGQKAITFINVACLIIIMQTHIG